MSDVSAETKLSELSAKVDDMVLGLKWMFSLFLLFLSIPNFCVSLSIFHFSQIFQNALPGMPLPFLTVAIISHRIIHHLLCLIWPLAGVLNIVMENAFETGPLERPFSAFLLDCNYA